MRRRAGGAAFDYRKQSNWSAKCTGIECGTGEKMANEMA